MQEVELRGKGRGRVFLDINHKNNKLKSKMEY